jgi:hypothetical protein
LRPEVGTFDTLCLIVGSRVRTPSIFDCARLDTKPPHRRIMRSARRLAGRLRKCTGTHTGGAGDASSIPYGCRFGISLIGTSAIIDRFRQERLRSSRFMKTSCSALPDHALEQMQRISVRSARHRSALSQSPEVSDARRPFERWEQTSHKKA